MSDDQTIEQEVEIAGASMSIAQLAQLDTAGIDEVRRFNFPKGFYIWEVDKAADIVVKENNDKEKQAIINVPLNCLKVEAGGGEKPEKCIGKQYYENFRIKKDDPEETIGQFKAFATDIRYQGSSALGEMVQGVREMKLAGPIKHSPNQNDPDNPWANLDRTKIRALTDEELASLAG